jgi:hypothetical protein
MSARSRKTDHKSVLVALLAALSLLLAPSAGWHSASAAASSQLKQAAGKQAKSKAQVADMDNAMSNTFFHPTDKSFVSRFLRHGQYMPVSEIKPGMVGYGLTVFHGNKIERFNVQIISVVKKVLSGRDAILARLSGGEMGKNCVIKGMSGSPCYINGRLIGAVSFGYDFEKEPIAGITPIVDMLDALADPSPTARPSIAHLSAPGWAGPPPSGNGIVPTAGAAPHMVPLMSPVSLTGFSPRAEAFLSEKFKDIGLGVSSGAAGALDPQLASVTERDIKPGSAVCVLLATGDFNIAATGTATARFGDKVVAFGHPFMQGGFIDFPMATAYVHQVMPSLSVSFKMASPVSVVGAVTADRPWGIGGHMGRMSHMIPASYTVIDETRHIQRTYNCQVIDHPEMTPEILSATATSAIDATHQTSGPYVAKVESRIEAAGIEPIVRTDRFAAGLAPKSFFDLFMGGDPVGRFVQRTTDQICNNDFQKAAIKSIKMKITIQDGHQTAKVDRVYIDKPYAAPGEEVKVTAVLKPFNKEPVEETISFRVPRDIPDGNMVIGVAGGQEYDYIKSRLGIVDPEPENLKQIARRIQDEGRGDQLAVVVALPEQSLMVNGTKLVNPPAYWTKVFFSNRHTKGPTLVKGEMKITRDLDCMLSGSHMIALEVRSPDKASARTAPYPIPAPYFNDDIATTDQARKALESFPSYNRKANAGRGGAVGGNNNNNNNNNNAGGLVLSGATNGGLPAANSNSGGNGGSKAATTGNTITAATGKEYPHVRPLQIWRQDSDDEFRAGKLDDATVDSWGRISPGFDSVAERQVSSEDQIWSGVWANGRFYFGSADEVWSWHGDGSKPERLAKLDGLFIPALAADSRGMLYAAAVPSGNIWAIDTRNPGSKPQIIYKVSEPLVACLTVDDKDNLYIGTAGEGKIYKLDPAHHGSLLLDCGQAHVLCFFYSKPDSTLYFGTGEKGSVYAIDGGGKVKAVYQSPDHFVTGIAKDKKGDLYIASAGQGHLVRMTPSGEQTTLASSEAFYKLHYDAASDSVFSGDAEGDITMACLDPLTKQPYFMPVCHTEQEAVLALASDGDNLYAGTSNLAVLRAFNMRLSAKPLYTSAVKDGGRTAQWFRIHAFGPFNEVSKDVNQHLKVETRTGETTKPDETWSAWQPAVLKDDAFVVSSPAGRYFQYRVSWNTKDDTFAADKVDKLTLGRIDITYLPQNSAPQISHISVKSGSAVSGKQEVAITGTDADGDNLLASIDFSADGGTSWKTLKEELRSKSSKKDGKSAGEDNDSEDDSDKASGSENPNKDDGKASTSDDSKSDKDNESQSDKLKDKEKAGDSDKDKDSKDGDGSGKSKDKDQDSSDKGNRGDSGKQKQKTDAGSAENAADKEKDSPAAAKGKGSANDKSGAAGKDKDKRDSKDNKDKDKDKNRASKHGKSKGSGHRSTSSGSGDNKSSTEGSGSSSESFSYSWDTTKQKDGHYLLRFTVDDRLSNPAHHEEVVNLRSVIVDNTAPEIALIDYKRQADGKLEFKVTAKDKLTPIANATYKIDDGEPFAFSFDPESIDGLNANLVAADVKIEKGSHKVEVKVSDRAGNTATKTITVKF